MTGSDLPSTAWQRRSAGTGSKGPRLYDWAWLDEVCTDADPDDDGRHSLLIRRNNTTGELAFYRCWTPRPVSLAALVRVAGIRWTVEEGFQAAKGQVGLDQHQVRRWHSWHRFTTLALAALAVLTICTADSRGQRDDPTRQTMIPLTVNEIRRLIKRSSSNRSATSSTVCTGQDGDAGIKPAPAEPTTHDASTSNSSHDHKRRLPY